MKKLLPLLCAMCLILTSCSYEEVSPGSGADADPGTTSDARDTAEPEFTADTTASGPESHEAGGHLLDREPVNDDAVSDFFSGDSALKIDMSKYSKAAKLLTADDIYLMSFNCGYVSDTEPCRLIIETEQQLDCALKEYGRMIADLLGETSEEYPISDYSYVLEYTAVGSGGYDLKAGALLVDIDALFFVQSSDSRTPDPFSDQTAVMDGFCYMAVLPKDMLLNEHYKSWTYPESKAELW